MAVLQRFQQLLQHRRLELLSRIDQLGLFRSIQRSLCITCNIRTDPHSTSISASNAPAAFIAWRIEMTSRAEAPIVCRLRTRSSTVAPCFSSILLTGLSCASSLVCWTTWVVPPDEKAFGWET